MGKIKNNLETPDVNAGKYIRIGLFAIFVMFGLVGGWSAYAQLDSGVPLPGQVVVESSKKVVQHLEGGIVEKIFVKDGDIVKKGDVLIKFEDTKSKSLKQSLEAQYYEALALEDRLIAENNREGKIVFSKELNKLEKSQKKRLIKTQKGIFNNRKSSFLKEKKIASQKIASLTQQIENVKEVIKSQESLLLSYKGEAKEQQDLYDEQYIDKVKLREVKRKIESLKSDILSNKTKITTTQIQISETETQLALSEEDFFKKIKLELRENRIKIADIRARLIDVDDRLERTALRAPENGTVLDMKVHTIGAVVSPGKPIMEIVPANSKLIIKAMLSPEYIDYVKVGLKANMTFPAFQLKGRFIKNIEGEVIFVAADSTTDKQGHSFYTIKLVVDKEGQQTLKDENLKILAGMPAGVVIKIGKQTLLEYLLRPMTVMVDKAFLEE